MLVEEVEKRELGDLQLPRWGRVVAVDGVVPWEVVDPRGRPVEPIQRFLQDFTARGNRAGSVRSYAYDLLRWWRWLQVVGVKWDQATSAEVRDLTLWLSRAVKPRTLPRTTSASTVGLVNPVTGKRHLSDNYESRTIRHSNAVLRGFYEFWAQVGEGPFVNPVPLDRGHGRPAAHHNPLAPFTADGRLRYNPKLPKQKPRAMSDERWAELFKALRSNRDRAVMALAISNGARASELLGVRMCDLDWGEQTVRVIRKGSRAEQRLPGSSEAFVWLRLYLAELGELGPTESLWWTIRRRDRGAGLQRQPMNYEALRAVFRRANALLGANWSMHDLRHTCAVRMARDQNLSLRDVQTILGHAHLTTTADIYLVEDDDQVIHRASQHLSERAHRAQNPPPPPKSTGYDAADLSVLFGDALK